MNLTSPAFSLGNSAACIAACQAIYVGPPTIQTDLGHVLIQDQGDSFIVAFRGSADVRDFLTDAQFTKEPMLLEGVPEGIEVHSGFLHSVNGLWQGLSAWFEELATKPVFITGHSLGGAQAMLFAKLFELAGQRVQAVYTFGQPRTGNLAFAKWYDRTLYWKTWRWVHEEDIVPRVPLLGYWHASPDVFMPSTGGYEVQPPWITKLCSDAIGLFRAYRARRVLGIDELLLDHHADAYAAAIGTLLAAPQ